MKVEERRVSYWAVQGERWCNVDGMIDAARALEWEQAGWRIVTKIFIRDAPVYGEVMFEERRVGRIKEPG